MNMYIKEIERPKLEQTDNKPPIHRVVKIWLLIGLVMVFIQVVVGGVTRLTDSGLSITEWAVIQGTLPPLNQAEWEEAFELYKVAAKKQYESLHADMTLSEFKVIFFWEYIHRLWARAMGFVFLLPFVFFVIKGWIPKWLMKNLGLVVLLAAAAATFGWIMVASGLNEDNRTWVSAYKLVAHLSIATAVFASLFWAYLRSLQPKTYDGHFPRLKRMAWSVTALLIVQIIFGGLMAGMKAGLVHPSFPWFVEGDRLLSALQSGNADLVNYESSASIKASVQIIHRATAYLLVAAMIAFFIKLIKAPISARLRRGGYTMITLIGVQFLLGVLTVINSIGRIPIGYGVLHQGVALLLLISMLYIIYQLKSKSVSKYVENH
ncbi:MAG: COX15/CtaA family protein [Bacteroidota bacterium]